jgi:N-acetylneuraminic acid mutarotase
MSESSTTPKNAWIRRAPLPVAIAEVGVGEIDGKLYVVGGTDQSGNFCSSNWMYDPALDRWQERAPLPRASSHIGITELGGQLYAVGGLSANVHMGPQGSVLAYDPQLDRWTALAPLSTPRGSLASAACRGKLHVFGGHDSTTTRKVRTEGGAEMIVGIGTVRTHEIYDPVAHQWSQSKALPGPPRDHMGVAVLDQKIHIFGGRTTDYSDMLDRHDVYDPATDSWVSAAPLPQPRSAGAFTVLAGLIIYAGGECKPGGEPFTANAFDDVTAYDPSANAWTALLPLPEGRHAFGAATIDGVAYFAGGALLCGGGASSDLLALRIH